MEPSRKARALSRVGGTAKRGAAGTARAVRLVLLAALGLIGALLAFIAIDRLIVADAERPVPRAGASHEGDA